MHRARPRSAELAARADVVLPGGNTRTVLFFEPFPFRVAKAWGWYLSDVDGHGYVDLLGEYTAGLLGHSQPAIRAAIDARARRRDELRRRTTPTRSGFAELIVRAVPVDRPGALHELRHRGEPDGGRAGARPPPAARQVLVFDGGYHGGLLSFAGHGGSPLNVPHPSVVGPTTTSTAPSGCSPSTATARRGAGGADARVRPAASRATRRSCERCDDGATRTGALLIFDEVMTSRLSPGGAQAVYGITPDLTTLGKYLGGGMSFGAFGGRRDLMAALRPDAAGGALGHAGTFNNNVLSMAAGLAGLTEVLTPAVLAAAERPRRPAARRARRGVPRARPADVRDRARVAHEHPRHGRAGGVGRRPARLERRVEGAVVLRRARRRLLHRPARLHRALDRGHRRRRVVVRRPSSTGGRGRYSSSRICLRLISNSTSLTRPCARSSSSALSRS